jgi:hypothetical protein
VPREQLLRLARLLNLLVVSGDRLGSHFGEQRLDELDHELGRWFRESGVWPQLSEARGELHDRLADDTTEGDAKLAQELAELPYWRPAQ